MADGAGLGPHHQAQHELAVSQSEELRRGLRVLVAEHEGRLFNDIYVWAGKQGLGDERVVELLEDMGETDLAEKLESELCSG